MGAEATQPTKRLGAWAARNVTVIYQAATDGFIVIDKIAGGGIIGIIVENVTPPTIVMEKQGGDQNDSICCPVPKGEYYQITELAGTMRTGWWIPLEP